MLTSLSQRRLRGHIRTLEERGFITRRRILNRRITHYAINVERIMAEASARERGMKTPGMEDGAPDETSADTGQNVRDEGTKRPLAPDETSGHTGQNVRSKETARETTIETAILNSKAKRDDDFPLPWETEDLVACE